MMAAPFAEFDEVQIVILDEAACRAPYLRMTNDDDAGLGRRQRNYRSPTRDCRGTSLWSA